MPTTPSRQRRPARFRFLGLTGLLAAAALIALPPVGAAAATPLGTNLVKNPGAENLLTSWDTFSNFTTLKYGSGAGFPSKSEGNRIGGGSRFFYAGPYDNVMTTCGDAQQDFTLSGISGAIDTGQIKVRLSGQLATNGAANLYAHLDLDFRDKDNEQTLSSAGIRRKVTQTNQHWVSISVTKTLPRKTRILHLHLRADGDAAASSGDCAAFWDNVSVKLTHA